MAPRTFRNGILRSQIIPRSSRAGVPVKLTFRILPIFALALTTGCDSGTMEPESASPGANLNVTLNWAEIDRLAFAAAQPSGMSPMIASLDSKPINRVGVRVEYPNEDAVFMQTVDRETAATSGVITMVLPPTSQARLFVLAVHEDPNSGGGEAKAVAQLDLGRLAPGRALKLTTASLNLIPATWTLSGDQSFTDVDGVRNIAIESASNVSLGLLARDPFGDVPTRNGSRRFIELNGSGNILGVSDGFRVMNQFISRGGAAAGSSSTATFHPYFNGALFNFGGNARFTVPPVARAVVTWQ
jgi:hypothetical protein